MKKVLTFLVLAILFSSCFRERVNGNGHITTEQYNVKSFDLVTTDGVFNVYIYQSDEYLVEVETDANIQDYVYVNSNNGNLTIDMNEKANIDATKLNINIFSPEYKHISCDGVVNIETKTMIYGDELEIFHDGVGDIDMSLSVSKLNINCDGVGDIDLMGDADIVKIINDGVGSIYSYGMETNEMYITNTGVGNSEVYVIEYLEAKATGVGSIYYKGNPVSVNSLVSGTGKVVAR